jgi:predicted AAA+ superfamily ATPase
LYPFLLEPGASLHQFTQIIKKIIQDDIPHFDPNLSLEDITLLEKTLTFIGKSPIDGINYSSISHNVGITKYKAEKYLSLLEKSFLIKCIFPKGTNVLKEPKVFMELPYRLVYRPYEECIGELREDFFALAAAQHEIDFHYVKTTRGKKTPDFILNINNTNVIIEIGGAGKGRTQFKGIDYDQKIVLFHSTPEARTSPPPRPGSRVPLHCLGFA